MHPELGDTLQPKVRSYECQGYWFYSCASWMCRCALLNGRNVGFGFPVFLTWQYAQDTFGILLWQYDHKTQSRSRSRIRCGGPLASSTAVHNTLENRKETATSFAPAWAFQLRTPHCMFSHHSVTQPYCKRPSAPSSLCPSLYSFELEKVASHV
jgi:hypothetical protein